MSTSTIINNSSSHIGYYILDYLMGKSMYSSELQSFGMALQANMIVQSRYNNNSSNYFYRFVLSILIGYSGGIFGTIYFNKICPFIINADLHFTCCIIAFILIQIILPYIQQLLLRYIQQHRMYINDNTDDSTTTTTTTTNTTTTTTVRILFYYSFILPIQIGITLYAQLFRTIGLIKFITVCYNELLLSSQSTKYYNIPIAGPILYGTMLGNMSGFILYGIDGYTNKNGIPYPFQNGIFCGTFYHLYVHDTNGILGTTLRYYIKPIISSILVLLLSTTTTTTGNKVDEDDDDESKIIIMLNNNNEMIATIIVSLFMQIIGILQLPICLGPTFSPFVTLYNMFFNFLAPFSSSNNNNNNNDDDDDNNATTTTIKEKKKNTTTTTTTTINNNKASDKDKKLQ